MTATSFADRRTDIRQTAQSQLNQMAQIGGMSDEARERMVDAILHTRREALARVEFDERRAAAAELLAKPDGISGRQCRCQISAANVSRWKRMADCTVQTRDDTGRAIEAPEFLVSHEWQLGSIVNTIAGCLALIRLDGTADVTQRLPQPMEIPGLAGHVLIPLSDVQLL